MDNQITDAEAAAGFELYDPGGNISEAAFALVQSAFIDVERDSQLAGQGPHSAGVVRMLMAHNHALKLVVSNAQRIKSRKDVPGGNAGIQQQRRFACPHKDGVALGTAHQYRGLKHPQILVRW